MEKGSAWFERQTPDDFTVATCLRPSVTPIFEEVGEEPNERSLLASSLGTIPLSFAFFRSHLAG
jgi:hypothetical protein